MIEVPFYSPDLTIREADFVSNTIQSRWVTNGPSTRRFEEKLASISGCKRAVAFDSCTAAMEMALRVLDIGPGDEVITTPYTYSATAEVIRNVGAKIVFVDLDGISFEMDYQKMEDAITEKTKAIIPVDIGGKLCDYDTILEIAKRKSNIFHPNSELQKSIGRIAVIADAAHSFGAERKGKMSGEYADFTCFSFHVVKPITTGGEGGAAVWNDFDGVDNDWIEQRMRLLGDHGQTTRSKENGWEYDIKLFGYNSIMTDVDAAMGLVQLRRFDEITKKRERTTRIYDQLFNDVTQATPLIKHIGDDYKSSFHLYPVKLNHPYQTERSRNVIFARLKAMGVHCNVHYKPLPMMTAYKDIGFNIIDFPNAYDMYKMMITIPYFSDINYDQQCYVVESIVKAVEGT